MCADCMANRVHGPLGANLYIQRLQLKELKINNNADFEAFMTQFGEVISTTLALGKDR